MGLLSSIETPGQLKSLTHQQLLQLVEEIRTRIIGTVAKNGGHLATAIAWYALFFLVGYLCACDPRKLLLLGKIFFLGSALTSVVTIFYFLHYPQYGYGVHLTPGGIYATAALGVLLVGLENGFIRKGWWSYGLAFLFAIGSVTLRCPDKLSRPLLNVGRGISVCAQSAQEKKNNGPEAATARRNSLNTYGSYTLNTQVGQKFMTAGLKMAYQGLFTPKQDPDAMWRSRLVTAM